MIEVEFVAHDAATSADGLDVGRIPGLRVVRHRNDWFTKRPVPVKTIPAEAEHDVVDFRPPSARVVVQDGEEAEHQALVGRGIEIVQFGLHLALGYALRVEFVAGEPLVYGV